MPNGLFYVCNERADACEQPFAKGTPFAKGIEQLRVVAAHRKVCGLKLEERSFLYDVNDR